MPESPNNELRSSYSLLTIPVAPTRRHEFVERFVRLDVFQRASDEAGMKRGWLLSPNAEDGELVVLAEWESTDAYERWLNSPVRGEVNADLSAYATGEMSGSTFVVAHSFGGDQGEHAAH